MGNLVVLMIAISIHYTVEYMGEHPCYSCPNYCDVDHIHLVCEVNIKLNLKQNEEIKNGFSMDTKQLDTLSIDILDGRKINENFSHSL